MKILMIGAGNMGLTYALGMANSPFKNKRNIMIYDVAKEVLEELSENPDFDTYSSLKDCAPIADIIFLAVKPYHSEELFKELKPLINQEQLIVSLMAGVTIATMQAGLGIKKVIRTMPNLPAKVGKGITSYTEAKEVSRVELIMVRNLLDTTGESIRVENENFIDASTGISGSGPAYVFYFMQSIMDAALKMGFSENDSKVLVSNTFEGAVELFNQSSLTAQGLMDKVASKGGTT